MPEAEAKPAPCAPALSPVPDRPTVTPKRVDPATWSLADEKRTVQRNRG